MTPISPSDRQARVLTALAEQELCRLLDGTTEWTAWLAYAAHPPTYGFVNTLLIAAQSRHPCEVRSYTDWIRQGHHVRKGEHGIRILSDDGSTTRSVFERSQTTAPDSTSSQSPDHAPDQAPDRASGQSQTSSHVSGETRGSGPQERLRSLTLALGLHETDPQRAARRLARLLLGEGDSAEVLRVEEESIAFLLLARLGFPAPSMSFPPVACWAESPSQIIAVGDRILLVTETVLDRPQPVENHSSVDALLDMHRQAHDFFLEQPVAPHLAERGIDPYAARRWLIGLAPAARHALVDRLKALGYPEEVIVASGLARRGRRDKLFDTFRSRIMFPLRNHDGRVVGFIGRRLGEGSRPKYLNSPESPIFHKNEILFGLYEGRRSLAAGARPVLVEGPFDAVATDAAVDPEEFAPLATCGSAVTAAQLASLDLDRTGILLAFDGDTAGRRAVLRAWDLLAGSTGRLGVVTLPEGRDPADIPREELPGLLRAERPLAEFVIDDRVEHAGGPLTYFQNRWDAATAAADIIARLPRDQVGAQVARLATRLDLDPRLITEALMAAISPSPDR
jgi:DNA primase